ncbi:hypothetical protein FOXB_11144 [Fusarium oxysporum f. sp. conglutinans Fo5176]|uniref:Uncharacterized protein n=1 Tax=Fusarium oxysporum (strain Fo5176) TaxID=660025 RepID=F9FXL2_FUSOF|nr:hypothetical protein FOXB_11144 [Fusarium oxysporum f. sp. conglutinans Fo5176]KAI8413882.1 hypothetical protein FOFC_07168 [Fusarium oxysporum]
MSALIAPKYRSTGRSNHFRSSLHLKKDREAWEAVYWEAVTRGGTRPKRQCVLYPPRRPYLGHNARSLKRSREPLPEKITFPRTVFHQFVDKIVNDLRPDGGFSVEGAALSGLQTATEDHLHFVLAFTVPLFEMRYLGDIDAPKLRYVSRQLQGERFVNGVWTLDHNLRNEDRDKGSKGLAGGGAASRKRKGFLQDRSTSKEDC